MKVSLMGNPNTGKTSLFNRVTGSYEYVGNWSGVTVEKKVGSFKHSDDKLVDLPGLYNFNPISADEAVVTNFFLNESCDKILNVVDASQLDRNLHLTLQMLDLEIPSVVALNMVDVAQNRGIVVESGKLSLALDVNVAPIVARTGQGCEKIDSAIKNADVSKFYVDYGTEINSGLVAFKAIVENKIKHPKWAYHQILEGNNVVKNHVSTVVENDDLDNLIEKVSKEVEANRGKIVAEFMFERRSKEIKQILKVCRKTDATPRTTTTEKIDKVLLNPILGIPIFLAMMFIIFKISFEWIGGPLSDALDGFISGTFATAVNNLLIALGASDMVISLVIDGIIAGVGGVLVFFPQIIVIFLCLSILEDSGYMARVAYVMDRLLEKAGLSGKSFVSMIIGFGCNVPGIMAARSIETPRERLLTILLTPFMSCSARLPVYAVFAGAFFAGNESIVVFSMYIIGIVLALILAKIFSKTIAKGEASFFVVELPPYRAPQALTLMKNTWDKGKHFIVRCGTIIFLGSVAIWVFSSFGSGGYGVPVEESFLAAIGMVLAPLFAPLGFGTWEATASLITGVFAKEAVVSSMAILYGSSTETGLITAVSEQFTKLSAYSYMVFTLLYIPCLATIAAIWKETRSAKWTFFSIGYSFVVAYIVCFLIYQVGTLLGF